MLNQGNSKLPAAATEITVNQLTLVVCSHAMILDKNENVELHIHKLVKK